MASQNDLDRIKDKLQKKEITLAQANVLLIRVEGFRLIAGPVPADIRKALNEAVKAGELGHLKKEGARPEAYFHPNSRDNAMNARTRKFNQSLDALAGVLAHRSHLETNV